MKKIIVLNNDPDTMSLLKAWLEKKGYNVKFTGNQNDAIRLLKSFDPFLIIIDILQSDTLHIIKSHPEFDHIPVLLMTGYTSKRAARNLPVNDTIEKPFDLPLFEQKIKNILKDNVKA